jgi:HK97 gp10 family phage protein
MVDIAIDGLSDLNDLLQQLPAKIEANVLRGGLRAGAVVIQQEAKRLVHDVSGALAASIRVTTKIKNGTSYALVIAGKHKAKDDPYYAHMVEFGTAAHWIKPKNRKSLFFAGLMREAVLHPGARPKPFMRPAMDSKAQAALGTMADYISERLPKEFDKIA